MSNDRLPEIPDMSADRLTSQLYHLPAIIGRLGLSVANAQSALNADYTENVKQLIAAIKDLVPAAEGDTSGNARTAIDGLLKQLAPSRYQFTETTLDFSADLAESLDVAGSIGLGAGFGAVVINAGVSLGYGRDYRAAARVTTTLHAIPADNTLTDKFLGQADKRRADGVTLPPRTQVDTAVNNNLRDIVAMSGGKELPALAPQLPMSPAQQAERTADEAEKHAAGALHFLKQTMEAQEDAVTAKDIAIDAAQPGDKRKAAAKEAERQANRAKAMATEATSSVSAARTAATEAANARDRAADEERTRAEAEAARAQTAVDGVTTVGDGTKDVIAEAAAAREAAVNAAAEAQESAG